ncbi:hypothetical protein GCM10009672_23630 [Nesterenkonia lutea]
MVTMLATGALALVACGEPEQQNDATPVAFEDVDELFSAVDDQLDCPEDSSGEYHFALPSDQDAEILQGRSCAESIVMASSDDEERLAEIREMMSSAQGPLSVVEDSTWFVADITEVAGDGEATDLAHPGSRDLQGLAEDWKATYTEQ